MIDEARIDQRFTAEDIRRMHRLWLREIYSWVGEYRQVNMAKGQAVNMLEGRRASLNQADCLSAAVAGSLRETVLISATACLIRAAAVDEDFQMKELGRIRVGNSHL